MDFNQGLLTIRQTKFNKSRLIPLHVSTRDVLAEYAQRRDRLIPTQSSPCFLLNDHGRCLESSNVRRTFYALSRQIGLRGAVDHTGPRTGACGRRRVIRHRAEAAPDHASHIVSGGTPDLVSVPEKAWQTAVKRIEILKPLLNMGDSERTFVHVKKAAPDSLSPIGGLNI